MSSWRYGKFFEGDANPKLNEFSYWNKLPIELQLLCIKKMDLRDISRFRRTSKTEKALVDMTKLEFSLLSIHVDEYLQFRRGLWTRVFDLEWHYTNPIEWVPGLVFCLNHIIVDLVLLRYNEFTNWTVSFRLRDFTNPLFAKHLRLFFAEDEEIYYWHEKADAATLKEVALQLKNKEPITFEKLQTLPKFLNANTLDIRSPTPIDTAEKIVEKWTDEDVPIGRKYKSHFVTAGSIDEFTELFSNRIREKILGAWRITTNDPGKHISFSFSVYHGKESFTMEIISVDTKLSIRTKEEVYLDLRRYDAPPFQSQLQLQPVEFREYIA
uniref:F-box domain-containing protein n=1 Tax=Caenorhabditis tropicalis TaxID=1561998 RepID=A0A1I7T9M8_9PELO